MSIESRFTQKVTKTDFCWLWSGAISGTGYGCLRVEGKTIAAHRLSYELHIGPIPEGMFVCHSCDNPRCVNPLHLFVGSNRDNIHDFYEKNGWKAPSRAGEKNGRAKVSADDVGKIRSKFVDLKKNCRDPVKRLSEEYGLSLRQIANIVKQRNWIDPGG